MFKREIVIVYKPIVCFIHSPAVKTSRKVSECVKKLANELHFNKEDNNSRVAMLFVLRGLEQKPRAVC